MTSDGNHIRRPSLFETSEIKGLTLANRLIRSATWTGMAEENGRSTLRLIALMVELVKGGVGLMITGHAYVQKKGQAGPWQLGIHRDEMIPGLRALTDAVHEHGGKIVVQLAHAGIYAVCELSGSLPVAVSTMDHLVSYPVEELTSDGVEAIVGAFGTAAERAKAAGFDGIQIHAAHGYLLNQFLSPAFNHRQDRYGGDSQKRLTMPLEVIQRVRQAVGPAYPVFVKMNAQDFLADGLELDDSVSAGAAFELAGIDAIEVSGGTRASGKMKSAREGIVSASDEAYFEDAMRAFRQRVSVPLIQVGGIRSLSVAQRLVSEGIADYVALSRPFIREPDLVNRWRRGDERKAACISDNRCLESGLKGNGVSCIARASYKNA